MARAHPLRDAGLALTLLTAIPVPATVPDGEPTDAAGWFPAVGLLLGGVAWFWLHVVEHFGWGVKQSLLAAALIVVFWALATRILHWDGLADVADGYWGSPDRERRLEIMSDSRVGAFGATAVALVCILEVAAVGAVIADGHQLPLLLVPVFGRLAATFAAWFGRPAKPGGLGRSVMGRPRLAAIVPAVLVVLPTLALLGRVEHWSKGWLGVLGLLLALVVPHLLSRRFGGVTGDVMGASVLITETLLFVAFAIWF